ncbi:sushi domain-containing protein 3 [Mastacembelus armatus]|uniref:Sushi domain-containing protein 3-like n=1 Tax=Mastacembelus armatus TaxID=205130 RepID=A0A3Q3NI23_9TELE|nr:sushi domain-containing protein 3-like [Mastacembelus armatus]
MSAATASGADVSRTDNTNKDDWNKSGQPQAQCAPMPLPALGTQRIIQGNGTNVGTVISLQCPAKHRLIGSKLTCVMDTNSTHWVGETYCKPLSPYEDYGFRVAVLASIVSSGIILLMSMAFITCCLLNCIKEDKRKKEERESDMWHCEEQTQHQENNRLHYSHKGRNNNNNTQEKMLSLWDTHNAAICDSMLVCRCHQEYAYGPACTYGSTPTPLAALPGHEYDQPLLHKNPEPAQISGLPQHPGPPPSPHHTRSPAPVQISSEGRGLIWKHGGGQQRSSTGWSPSTTDQSNTRSLNPTTEFSIKIISV